MTQLATLLGMWAIGATVWALEMRSYCKAVKEDRDLWHKMYVQAAERADELSAALGYDDALPTPDSGGAT